MTRPHVPIRTAYAALLAAVTALALYLPALGNGFAYDDVAIVAGDARIQSLDRLDEVFTHGYWPDDDQALYRPLTTLSFALDWSLAPDRPAWFHLINAVLHAVATALVTLLVARFWPPFAALAAGVLFAVHPVHVEAVANIVGRAELLAAIGFLGACLAWSAGPREGTPAPLRTVATPALFSLALFSKESAIMLPAVLPLLDVARGDLRHGNVRIWLARAAKPYVLLAIVAIGYFVARAAVLGEAGGPDRLDPSLEVLGSGGERIMTALTAWPEYARLLFFPRTLLADYGPRILGPAMSLDADVALGALILLATVAGGIAALAMGRRLGALALLWFPITILPVSNLLVPIGVLVAERTLYLPLVALCLGAAAVTRWLAHRTTTHADDPADADAPAGKALTPRRTSVAVAVAVAVVLAARTLIRIPDWASTDTIMTALVRDRPDAFRGHWHLARMARAAGDERRALAEYMQALELWPYRTRLVLETIGFSARTGDLAYADRLSRWAVERWPTNVDARRYLAATALDRGDTATARIAVKHGLRMAPRDQTFLDMARAIALDPPQDSTVR